MSNIQVDTTVALIKDQLIDSEFLTESIDVQQMEGFSFHVIWDDVNTINGEVTLESSLNDKNFVKVNGSGQSVKGTSGEHIYDVDAFHYRYMRLRIVPSSGSSTFTIYLNSRSRRT